MVTSDIEETVDLAAVNGRALIAGHEVTWRAGGVTVFRGTRQLPTGGG